MLDSTRSVLRRLATESRGTEIAEAAAVLPLMFMVLLGIFWFGQAFSTYGTITRAAQEGARAGVAPYCTTCTAGPAPDQNAFNAVQASMSAAKLDLTKARVPPTTPAFNLCGGGASGGCDGGITGNSNNVCVQNQVLMSSSPGSGGVCGVSVSFQYPFQFWLPFTSLNKQKIWLTASAHARVENQ